MNENQLNNRAAVYSNYEPSFLLGAVIENDHKQYDISSFF